MLAWFSLRLAFVFYGTRSFFERQTLCTVYSVPLSARHWRERLDNATRLESKAPITENHEAEGLLTSHSPRLYLHAERLMLFAVSFPPCYLVRLALERLDQR